MGAWATTADLTRRYPYVTKEQLGRAEAFIEDASALVADELSHAGLAVDERDEAQAAALRAVVCSMVVRALPAFGQEGYAPMKSFQETVGPFSGQVTLANPTGDLYLTSAERKWLGIDAARHRMRVVYASADVLGGGDDG